MSTNPYDQLLKDVRKAYEVVTELPDPKVDVKNPNFPLPDSLDPVVSAQSKLNYLNHLLQNSGYACWVSKMPAWPVLQEHR